MNNIAKKALYSALLAGGLSVLGAGAAHAIDLNLGGDDGLLSGTDVLAELGLPITVTGNSISVIGDSASSGSSTPAQQATPAPSTSSDTAASSTSLLRPVNSIISIGLNGSGDGLLGLNGPILLGAGDGIPLLGVGQIGIADIGSGTDVDVDAMVPVTVTGNSISVIGDSRSGNGGAGDATGSDADGDATAGSNGVLGDIGIIGGIGVLGGINLLGDNGQNGTSGILSGSVIGADAMLPISVTCNSVSVIGSSDSTGCVTAAAAPPTGPTDPTDPGESSTPGATGVGLAGTGADVTGALGFGALALALGVIVTIAQRRFGVSG